MKSATQAYMGGRGHEAKPKKSLSHMVIRQGEKGGHVIEHHHTEPMHHEAEHFIFGQQEGPEAHEHIAKHMGMKMPAAKPQSPDEEEEEETGKGD